MTGFKKKAALVVILEDVLLSKNVKPLIATLRLRQGLVNKQFNFNARPDGIFVAIATLDGLIAGKVTAVVDCVVPLSGTSLVPDFVVGRKTESTINP